MEGIKMGLAGEEGEMKCKMERQTKERAWKSPIGWWRASQPLPSAPLTFLELDLAQVGIFCPLMLEVRVKQKYIIPRCQWKRFYLKHLLPELACLPSPGPNRCVFLASFPPAGLGECWKFFLKVQLELDSLNWRKGRMAAIPLAWNIFQSWFCFSV